MSIKTIYLIRHGETDYNRRGVVQGSGIDSDLNEVGHAQAEAFFEAYQHVPFDKIYTSKLRRTVQSVQPFIDSGIPFEQLAGLNEISWGNQEGKMPDYQNDDYYKNLIKNWQNGNTSLKTDNGESPEDVMRRQKEAFVHILSKTEEETILVAMHGRAIRILLAWITRQPLSQMDTFEHSNLCLYKLTYSYEKGTFEIEVSNDTTHLLMVAV